MFSNLRTTLSWTTALLLLSDVSAHGWVTSPVSKNEMAYHHYEYGMPIDFQYEPQTCNIGNGIGSMLNTGGATCGAKDPISSQGLHVWQQWYDKASIDVPRLVPGTDVEFNITLTIDHGGQAWMEIACAEDISEKNEWLILARAESDRQRHFMPSAPGAIAWAPLEFLKTQGGRFSTTHHIPETFMCTSGHGVARWIWKTGNSCNDANNIARKTEKFSPKELAAVIHAYQPGWVNQNCTTPPETFISCMDFLIGVTPPAPPAPPTPPSPPSPPAAPCTNGAFKQCGGPGGYSGPTCCEGSCTCTGSHYYKQCKPPQGFNGKCKK